LSYIYEAVLADGELNSPCIYSNKASVLQKIKFVFLHLVRSTHTSIPTHSGKECEKGRRFNRGVSFFTESQNHRITE